MYVQRTTSVALPLMIALLGWHDISQVNIICLGCIHLGNVPLNAAHDPYSE